MADITTDITTLSQSFDTIVSALAKYTADDTKQKGASSKALDSIIKSFSLLQTTLVTPENGVTRLDNIKNFFGDSGFVKTLSNISTDKKTLEDFKSNVTNICETFGGGDSSLGKQLELLSAPLASLKKGIDKLPSFEVPDGEESLAVTFKKRFDSISELAASLDGLEINDIEFKIPDISNLFNSIIETSIEKEDIKVKDWEEITQDEFDALQDGQAIVKKLEATETEAAKFFKQVEKLNGTKDVTKYSSKLNAFTTNLLETAKVLNPFKNALSTFVKQNLSPTYKGADIKATEDIYKVDENGKPTNELLYKKGDVIASAVPQPITKELIGQKIGDINSLIAIGNEFQSLNLGVNYADMTKLQVKLYDFIQENVVGTGKTTEEKINTSDGLPLISLLLGDVVKPFNVYRTGLVGFVNGIDSATSDEYETNKLEWVSEKGKDGWKTVQAKKKGKLSQDIPGLEGKITNFLNLINVDTIKSWMTPITKLKVIGTTVNNITGKYTADGKTKYVVVDNINSVVNSMSEIMKAIRKLPSKVTDDANDKNIQKKMQSISNVVHAFAKEALVFNTMTELDTLPYLVDSLRLNDKEIVVGGEYVDEEGGGQVIDEKKYRSLNKEQQKKYTFRAKTKDLSMTHSIQMLCTFMSDIVKSVDKVSSVSIKTLLVAPVKVRILSKGISKSLTAMISAIDYINQEADIHNIQQVIGWEEGNNQYLINADGSYKMETYINEYGKEDKKKIENARYTKGHFKAETGLFKIGDYMATMIGIVEKIGNINPLTIKKSSVKIKMCIGLIAKSVADIANALASEMKGVSDKMSSEDMEIMLGVTRKDVYQIGQRGEANQIGEVKQEGLFTGLLTFFSIYENMMKIATEGGIKVILQTEIAKMRILGIINAMAEISESLMNSNIKGDSKELTSKINSLKDSINSLKSIASGLADSKLASNTTIAERTIKSMRDIFDMLMGKGNNDKEQPILMKLSQLTAKYEEMNKDSKGSSSLKSLSDDMKSISAIVASFTLMSMLAPIAITGVIGTKMFLSIFMGRDPKTGKEEGNKDTGGGIIGMIIKLRKRWNEAENESGESVRATLLMMSGSLLLFMGTFAIIGKIAPAAIKGVILTGVIFVLILAIFKVVQFIAKMGKKNDTGDGSVLSKLFTAKEQKAQIPSVKTMLMIAGGFIMFVMSLSLISFFGKYAIKGLFVVAGLLILTMGILWIVNKILTMGTGIRQRMFDVGIMKMGSDIPVIQMLLGISAGIILFTVSLSLVALFAPYAFKGMIAFAGLVMTAILLLTLIMKIASLGSNLANKFSVNGLIGGDNNIPAVKMLLMISAGFLMFTMSLILIQLVKKVAWEGLLAVTLMVGITLVVLMKLSSMDKNISDARNALIGVAIAMLGFTISLIVISVLIKSVGFGVVMGSLLTLLIGVGICVGALYLINMIGVANVIKGAVSILIMAGAFIVFGIALKIISNALNVLSWENIGKLVLVIGMFIGVTLLAGMGIAYIAVGAAAMAVMSGALLLFAVMLDKLGKAIKDVSIDMFFSLPGIMGMLILTLSTAALGILTVPIGSAVVTMMSGSLLLFGEMLDKMKKAIKGVTSDMFKDLPGIMGSLQLVFLKAALGILTVPIGAPVITMMSAPLLLLSETLPKLKDAIRGMRSNDFEHLSDIMSELRSVFKQAALGYFTIMIGTPAINLMSASLTVFSIALSKVKPNISGLSSDEFSALPKIMGKLLGTFSIAAGGIMTVPLGSAVISMMSTPLLMMSKAFVNIREAFKGMSVKEGDNPFEHMITGMVKGFGTAITAIRDIDIKRKDIKKFRRLKRISRNVSEIALLLSDIANMQIACEWDKSGNPTKYRQMNNNDFKMAKENVGHIMSAMVDIAKSLMSDEGVGKELKNVKKRDIKRQVRRMKAVMGIVEPLTAMVDFIKALAEGKLTIYDDATQKDKTISFNEYFGNSALRDKIKANIDSLIFFINDIASDIGAENSTLKMKKSDRKAAEKQADRMGAAAGIIDPLMSLVDFIRLLAEGTLEHVDENGKKTKISITKMIQDETLRNKIKDTTLGLMQMMNAIAHDINESNLEVEEIDADDLMTNADIINGVMASISNIANAKSTDSYVKVADSTSKLVHAINELDTTKGSVFKDILNDLEKMNYSLGDVFNRIEDAIVRLSEELGKMNGVELNSVSSGKPSSSSTTTVQTVSSPNLTNIESDVDDLLNELRSIKALMQR